MKIGIVYDCLYPYSKGGVEKRIDEFARRLAARHEVHLFSMKYWEGNAVRRTDNIYYHGVCRAEELYNRNGKRSIFQAVRFSFFLFFALIKEELDWVECQNIPYFPCFPCFLYCLIRKKPLIIVWYEVWGSYWYEYIGWKGGFGVLIERMASRLTENHIAVSNQTQRNFIKVGKVHPPVIPPTGIDMRMIDEAQPSSELFDVLYVGRLIAEKNVDLLVESLSIANLPNIRCGIIGDGPERENLEALTRRLYLTERVKFLGFVENVYGYMKSAKIFVTPSRREGFGIVVVEANACGTPVLVLNHPNNAATELIIGKNGFICQDGAEIAEKTRQLLTDDDLRREMSQFSVQAACRFQWDEIIQQYEHFCDSVLRKI
jgi:glycosyltransferase involved in cell wall biosynthesis